MTALRLAGGALYAAGIELQDSAAARARVPLWPTSDASRSPLSPSHSFAVLSSLPVTTREPSGLKATADTLP